MLDPMSWPEWGSDAPAGTQMYIGDGAHVGPIIADTLPSCLVRDDCAPYTLIHCRPCILNHIVGTLPPEDVRTAHRGWPEAEYLQSWAKKKQEIPCYILETVLDPQEFLLQLHEGMHPRSILHIRVLNAFDPLSMALQQSTGIPIWWVAPPRRLTYFSPKSLQLLVRRCGFAITEQFTFFTDQFTDDWELLAEGAMEQLKRQQMAEYRLGDQLYLRAEKR